MLAVDVDSTDMVQINPDLYSDYEVCKIDTHVA